MDAESQFVEELKQLITELADALHVFVDAEEKCVSLYQPKDEWIAELKALIQRAREAALKDLIK